MKASNRFLFLTTKTMHMKVLKLMLVGLFLLNLQTADAQRHPRPDHQGERDVMKALNLTPEQQQKITQLREDHHAAMKQTRTAKFESNEDRREAAKRLRKQHRDDIKAVLTPEQQTKMKELQKGRRELHREKMEERRNDPERKAKREAARTYHEQNIEPVLKKQRAKLNVEPADQQELDRLRAQWASKKEELKERRKTRERGTRAERPAPENREAMRANREAMRTLVQKYQPQIKALMEEIEPQREQWKRDLKNILGEDARPERPQGQRAPREGAAERREKMMKGMGAAKFLLLDPQG